MSENSDRKTEGEKQPSGDPMEVRGLQSFGPISDRERSIYLAGMNAGSSQVLAEIGEQMAAFTNQSRAMSAERAKTAVKILSELEVPLATKLGTRLGSAIKTFIDKTSF